MDTGLRGATVLVTGASGGIGLDTCRIFLEQGCKVIGHYNNNSGSLDGLKDSFKDRAEFVAMQANLTSEEDVNRLFRSSQEHFGQAVQVAVINHGIWPTNDTPLKDMSLDQWDKTINTNLTSSFLVAREYLKQLGTAPESLKALASIVFIGSTAGKYGEAMHADYAASKSAMMYGLTMTLKNEIVSIAPKGRVNCVAPGWVKTPMATAAMEKPGVLYRALATTPLKKVATPRDVASQILVLSSPTISGHVTGQVLMVEGGMEGRLLNLPEDIA